MARLIILALGRRKALIACGVALVIVGVIWGTAGSHQVSYENSLQGATYHIGTGTESGNVFVNADGSSDYFVALSGSFTPPITQSDIDTSTSIRFVARTDTTSVNLEVNGTSVDEAHPIQQLIFYDKTGNVLSSHTTAEYTAHPNGFYDNEWLKAVWLTIIGLILALAALFYPRLRRQRQASASVPVAATGAQYPQPSYQPGPYGQPYQGPAQYPQAAPYSPPYPPQPSGYGQPGGNPYQQPPQR